MAPKRGNRKSAPEGMNGITLNHSRRSPRVTSSSFDVNENSSSLKTPAPSSGDIRFYYNPKTPTSSKSLPSPTTDAPSTRRKIFQARPSRLSTVYTPVVDTPNSSQTSRRTRRMTALDTPQPKDTKNETPEGLSSTGWSFDQYMGGTDATTDPASPSVASSKGTRASARLRKPTTRAIESRQTDMARWKYTTSATKGKGKGKGANQPRLEPAMDETANISTVDTDTTTTPKAAKSTKATKTLGKKGKEPAKAQTPRDEDVPVAPVNPVAPAGNYPMDEDSVDRVLEELRYLLSLPDDAYPYSMELVEKQEAQFVWEREASVKLHTFAKTSNPSIEEDGWVQTGRVNASGEEIVVAPSSEVPYWCAQTYDENLPIPPVRSRHPTQARGDTTLGFPPRLGDKNVPCNFDPQFADQDFWADAPRLDPSEARQPAAAAPAPAPASAPAASTREKGKRRESAPAPASKTDSAQPAEDSSQKKQRSRRARASLPGGPVTATPSSSKVASARVSAKAKKTATMAQDPTASQDADGAAEGGDVPRPFRLKLSQPRPEASAAVEQSSSTTKGKKRAANMVDGEPAPGKGTGAKRPRLASGIDSEASEPPKRASSTKKGKQRL